MKKNDASKTSAVTKDVQIRGGLPQVASRLADGGSLRVVYFGGSITDAPGWRVGFDAWLRVNFPQTDISMQNASIGGTGSDLGVFRVAHDVLAYEPDLVFVEFSVNDSNKDLIRCGYCVEGIVRQIRHARPRCDICFVYTLSSTPSVIEPFRHGALPPAAVVHDRIAAHYGLPSVVLGAEVLRREAAGRLALVAKNEAHAELERQGITVFCEDGVHPLPAGHDLYVRALADAFPQLLTASLDTASLPELLAVPSWEDAQLVPVSRLNLDEGVERLAAANWPPVAWGREHLPELWRVEQEGLGITCDFTGTAFGLYDILGPDCGQVRVSIDDQPPMLVPRIDAYSSYHRPNYAVLADTLPCTSHRVRIEVGPPLTDKAAVIPEAGRNPGGFAGNIWYPAAVLIVGELA